MENQNVLEKPLHQRRTLDRGSETVFDQKNLGLIAAIRTG
jgi:hypothetical protein